MSNICNVKDCEGGVVAHGLCDKHRKRLSRHGHLKTTRPDDWGKKEKHPLYNSWTWMRKMRTKFSIYEEWEDFWKYVEDMGERPSSNHRIKRIDKHGNYSPDNCQWVEVIPNRDRADYARQWRKDNPEKVKNNDLYKKYGITLEDYNKMHKEQDGKCKICDKEESYKGYSLAVDHCHETGEIRGLLCSTCNRALGMFKDSITNLQNAINYLKK